MSFGFSISDFLGCAQLAWQIYEALKTGTVDCQVFAIDVLLFHGVLVKMGYTIRDIKHHLNADELSSLKRHCDHCEELLCSTIMGTFLPPHYREQIRKHAYQRSYDGIRAFDMKSSGSQSLVLQFRERVRHASVARKIPDARRQITAQIEKMTAYNVLLIQCFCHFQHLSSSSLTVHQIISKPYPGFSRPNYKLADASGKCTRAH